MAERERSCRGNELVRSAAHKPLVNKHCSITLTTTHPRDAMRLGAEEIEATQLTGV